MMLVGALVYAVHAISVPAGWAPATPPALDLRSPRYASLGDNGSVAILLARTGGRFHSGTRLLIVRANGTRLTLRAPAPETAQGLGPSVKGWICRSDTSDCPYFESVTLARDGTPFVTVAHSFSGAYSGIRRASFLWNGAWHAIAQAKPFGAAGKPQDPDNITIAAAESADRFAYVGDYADSFPQEDLDLALRDVRYMADISAVQYYSRNTILGLGNATAMRGDFVAGFDAGLKLVRAGEDSVAILWRCEFKSLAANRCSRRQLGSGVAYGVDSRGNVVGDNRSTYSTTNAVSSPDQTARASIGFPVLWRSGRPIVLAQSTGSAYAISENGTIVGESYVPEPRKARLSSAFVANANDSHPVAQPLDLLLRPAASFHVQSAFGITGDGRILALVQNETRAQAIAILSPATL